ncbi:MAG: N-acetylneuraminate synthase family protein [Deefgea sp.]
MIIVMQSNAEEEQVARVIEQIRAAGLKEHVSRGAELVIIGAIGDEDRLVQAHFEVLPGVERVSRITKQYKMVSQATHPAGTQFKVRGATIGGEAIQVFAGIHGCNLPACDTQIEAAMQTLGCRFIWSRLEQAAGSPYEFHGPNLDGLSRLRKLCRQHARPFSVELNDVQSLDLLLANDVDVIQLGAQSMQNRALLRELGRINKPIILRRGLAATVTEWLLAAETIAAGGNHHIILCEQGSRAFLDVSVVPLLKRETHLPVFVDASAASAKAWMVPALARASVAAGADGLMVDLQVEPASSAWSGDRAVDVEQFKQLMSRLGVMASALGRSI